MIYTVCPICENRIDGYFKDILSYQEWRISGLCQACQDATFEEISEIIIDLEQSKLLTPRG